MHSGNADGLPASKRTALRTLSSLQMATVHMPLAAQQFFHEFGDKFKFEITQVIGLPMTKRFLKNSGLTNR